MFKIYFALLSFLFFFSLNTVNIISQPIVPCVENHAEVWANRVITRLPLDQTQLIANIIYLLYANAVLDMKVRLFIIPMTRLTQAIRSNVINYKTTTNELSVLNTLTNRLSLVMGARTIYNKKLTVSLDFCEKNSSPEIIALIDDLQKHGQNELHNYVQRKHTDLAKTLSLSGEILKSHISSISSIALFHADCSVNTIAFSDLDQILKNNMISTHNIEHVLNTLDSSTEFVLDLIAYATEVYKEHYSKLYDHVSSDSYDKAYATTLFGINDLLPVEFKSLLPDPQNVFEHVLHEVKLYTQAELIQ